MFGLSVAIATPFDKDDKIEVNEFRNQISNLLTSKIDSITFFGTTGEGPSISFSEKIQTLEYLLSYELSPKQIYVSIIQSNYKSAKIEIDKYNELGINKFLVSPPFFFKELDQNALEKWFINLFSNIFQSLYLNLCVIITYINILKMFLKKIVRFYKNLMLIYISIFFRG